MAHGRPGPDIVMNIRYAGGSEIRAVSVHEMKRTPDGASAIDSTRSKLNEVLEGPATQSKALEELWAKGVRPPTGQAERPYVQMVLSASPEYFRGPGQGRGQWDEERLKAWKAATMKWLRDEYGEDLVHASLHLDEDTPHIHALIVPTYEKRPRVPGRRKRGESEEAFQARRREAENAFGVRTAGRASCEQWSRNYARRYARKSYHARMFPLGLGYGRDFVEEGKPSPDHRTTGEWVREQAAEVVQAKARVAATAAAVIEGAEAKAAVVVQDAEAVAATVIQNAEATAAEAEARRVEADEDARRAAEKAAALLTATAALTAEMAAGTISRNEKGGIRVKTAAPIKPALPDLTPFLNVAADAAEARRREEQAAVAAKAELDRAKAEANEARDRAAKILKEAEAERKAARSVMERLNIVLDEAAKFLRVPNLPAAVRKAGAAFLTAAGRPVPEPATTGRGGFSPAQWAFEQKKAEVSAPAQQPRQEPAPAPVDRSDDLGM